MMKFLNNVTQKKNIFIIPFFAGILVSSVFFAAIYFSFNIAIIAAAVIFTCLLLLALPFIIQRIQAGKDKAPTKTEEQPVALEDEGYDSANGSEGEGEDEDKEDIEISPEEQEKTQFQVQEDLANARERERMERGWLGGSINALGEPINSEPSMDLCSQLPSKPVNKIPEVVMLSLPDHMDLYGNPLPDQVIYTENSYLVCESQKPKQDSYVPMESLPDSMDVLGNKLPYSPSTRINMNSTPEQCAQKLSPAEWLLKNEPWVLKQCPVKMPATTEDILNQRG